MYRTSWHFLNFLHLFPFVFRSPFHLSFQFVTARWEGIFLALFLVYHPFCPARGHSNYYNGEEQFHVYNQQPDKHHTHKLVDG